MFIMATTLRAKDADAIRDAICDDATLMFVTLLR